MPRINDQSPPLFHNELHHLYRAEEKCREIADSVAAGDIQHIAANLEGMIMEYYNDVRTQSEQNFSYAKRATLIGLLFFIAAVCFTLTKSQIWLNMGIISLISGSFCRSSRILDCGSLL
jgi:hypothetical protein